MRGRLVLVLALGCLMACNAILGVDFEGRQRDSVDGGEAAPPEEEDSDAAAPKDGEVAKDSSLEAAVDGGYLADLEKLAKLRVRVADAPSLENYFVSRSWIHWLDGVGRGDSLKPSDGATRDLPIASKVMNDDVFAYRPTTVDDLSVRSASSGQVLGAFDIDMSVALDEGVVMLDGSTTARVWRSSSPTTLGTIGTLPSSAVNPLGKYGNTLYLKNFLDLNKLIVVDIAPVGVRSVDISVLPQAVTRITEGIVLTHIIGATETHFQLVPPTGAPIDLTAEIEAAKSNIPLADRVAFQHPAAVGDWLVFSAQCGILAFRHRDSRLVALQLRTDADDYFYNGVHVVHASRTLVFTMSKSKQGLYYSKLDGLLP
jgi:hypothetical protein